MNFKILISTTIAALAMASCGTETEKKEDKKTVTEKPAAPAALVLEATQPGPEYPGATLTIKDIKATPIEGTDSVTVVVNYDVQKYELKMQTSDAQSRSCNNSKEGQHIHFILDNGPYVALYEPTHTFKTKKGSEHVLLSFLSRSYHLSLKNKEAYALLKFKVDEKGGIVKEAAPKEPMIFYSRPKGTYIGDDTKEVLLDFYLVNTDLTKDSLKVNAIINGESKEIAKWEPFIMKGLPMGENKIQLNLVKVDGTSLKDNGYTSVSRTFTLAESEPIKK